MRAGTAAERDEETRPRRKMHESVGFMVAIMVAMLR